jgi:hypothetical protein
MFEGSSRRGLDFPWAPLAFEDSARCAPRYASSVDPLGRSRLAEPPPRRVQFVIEL